MIRLLNVLIVAGVFGAMMIGLGLLVWAWVFVILLIIDLLGAGSIFAISIVLLTAGLFASWAIGGQRLS